GSEGRVWVLGNERPAVLAVGGGAVETDEIRQALRERALTVHVAIDAADAWARVADSDRPLARDEQSFRALHARRTPLYAQAADAVAGDVEGVVLAAAGIVVEEGLLSRLDELVPGDGGEGIGDASALGLPPPPLEGPGPALGRGEEGRAP